MTIPSNTGELWPPLGQTVDSTNAILAGRTFLPPDDLAPLRHAGMRAYLGIGASTPDDGDTLNAVRAYRPQLVEFAALRHAGLQTYLGLGTGSTNVEDANLILATQVFGA